MSWISIPIWEIVFFTLSGILCLTLLYATLVSRKEKEKRASKRLGGLFLVSLLFILMVFLLPVANLPAYLGIIYILLLLLFLLFLLPWPEKEVSFEPMDAGRIDERTIMFSRAELQKDSPNYAVYYKNHPEHLVPDEGFRSSPGLLATDSRHYNPLLFAAADASFFTVESFHSKTDGSINLQPPKVDIGKIQTFLEQWAKEMGCHSIGFTALKETHLYTVGGRKHNYGKETENNHKMAIAYTVEMDSDRVSAAPRSPIILESANQYLNAGNIAIQLAAFLRTMGFPARAHIDGKYQVRCPQLARDAGLGEIGRMGLLMTPILGPRVRIGVVTTDAPLTPSRRVEDPSVIKFCELCKKCAETCPSQAIAYEDRIITNGALTWTINQEKCFSYWCEVGTDCGRCMAVCPYSHPNNPMHNLVRSLIRKAPLFRKVAYKMDDWLYGRKPPSRELPDWMNPKN